jgi:hypothetical protein
LTGLHDPALGVRRVLWLAYGVLAIALIFFTAAIVMLRDHHAPGITAQPPAAASPSNGPALTQNPPASTPPGSDQARAQTPGAGGQLTHTGGTPGEPPGDIEDEPRGGSSSGTGGGIPPANSGGGNLPPVTLPSPVVPALPSAVAPQAAPSVLASALPSPRF